MNFEFSRTFMTFLTCVVDELFVEVSFFQETSSYSKNSIRIIRVLEQNRF